MDIRQKVDKRIKEMEKLNSQLCELKELQSSLKNQVLKENLKQEIEIGIPTFDLIMLGPVRWHRVRIHQDLGIENLPINFTTMLSKEVELRIFEIETELTKLLSEDK